MNEVVQKEKPELIIVGLGKFKERMATEIDTKIKFGVENEVVSCFWHNEYLSGVAAYPSTGNFFRDKEGNYLSINSINSHNEPNESYGRVLRGLEKFNNSVKKYPGFKLPGVGSDGGGYEYRFSPYTFEQIIKLAPVFKEYFELLRMHNGTEFNRTAGLHVHIDVAAFFNMRSYLKAIDQFSLQLKDLSGRGAILNRLWTAIHRRNIGHPGVNNTSGNRSEVYANICYMQHAATTELKGQPYNSSGDYRFKSDAPNSWSTNIIKLNNHGLGTLEFRCFHSTVYYPSFMSALEFVRAFAKFALYEPENELEYQIGKQSYPDFVSMIENNPEQYPHIFKTLKSITGKSYSFPTVKEEAAAIPA